MVDNVLALEESLTLTQKLSTIMSTVSGYYLILGNH